VHPPAARYDSTVAGLDEASARSALAEMQERLVRGPHAALGIPLNATPDDARAAFLQLTKQYHPVRFGRMPSEIQKLANEVFLALRAVHDGFARPARRPGGVTQPVAVVPPPVAASTVAANGRPLQPSRPSRPAPVQDPGERLATTSGSARPVAPRPAVPPAVADPAASVAAPAAHPPPPATGPRPPATPRATGSVPVTGSVLVTGSALVTGRDETSVLDLLQRQQWDQARSVLTQLSARDPSSKRVRALVCYARGRQAQLERRLDDARVELQDALDLDPELQVAKAALTELFTRRK